MNDAFCTLAKEAEGVYTEKKSVFTGVGRSVSDESDALLFLSAMKKRFAEARHIAHAFVIDDNMFRMSDAGEPSGTAGKPILETIRRSGLTRCAVAVARDFGGILLGAGGLARAYGSAAKAAIDACGIAIMQKTLRLEFAAPYAMWDTIRYQLSLLPCEITETVYTEAVTVHVRVREADARSVTDMLTSISSGRITTTTNQTKFEAWN